MSGISLKAAGAAVAVMAIIGGVVYVTEQSRKLERAETLNVALTNGLAEANGVIAIQKQSQQMAAAIDRMYTEKLADAKQKISDLERNVAAGRQRLQLNANCQKAMSGSGTAAGMDDGASPRLNDAAKRDYFTLRERIETATVQIAGLQEYIKTQCQ